MADRVGSLYVQLRTNRRQPILVHPLKKDVMHQLMIAKANGQLWKCIVFKNDHKIVNQLVRYAF